MRRSKTVAITEKLMDEMRSEAKWRASKGSDKTANEIAEQVIRDFGLAEADNVSDEKYVAIREEIAEVIE